MMLLKNWLALTSLWREVFPQQRTTARAIRQGLGALVCLGRRTLTRIIWANGGEQRNWSSEYFLHSRVPWEPQGLFATVLKQALPLCPGRLVGVAVDDTKLPKWRRYARRPSCLDLITPLRKEMDENPQMLLHLGINNSLQDLAAAAAA